jgi:hypothetical protein
MNLGHRNPDGVKLNRQSRFGLYLSFAKLLPSRQSGAFAGHQQPSNRGETAMSKGEQRSNREAKKPKKEKIKTIAAAPSQKSVGSLQPGVGAIKRK